MSTQLMTRLVVYELKSATHSVDGGISVKALKLDRFEQCTGEEVREMDRLMD